MDVTVDLKRTLLPALAGSLLVISSGCADRDDTTAHSPVTQTVIAPERKAIATIEGAEVKADQFNLIYQRFVSQSRFPENKIPPAIAARTKITIAQRLIDFDLVDKAAKRANITISDQVLSQELAAFKAKFSSASAYQTYQSRQPQGQLSVEKFLRHRLQINQLLKIPGVEAVTEEQALTYYSQHASRFNIPAHLQIREIVVTDVAKAQEFKEKLLQEPEHFASLARQYSQAKSAKVGGMRPRVVKSSVPAAVWSAFATLAEGDIAGPISTGEGYYLVTLLANKPAQVVDYEMVKDKIKHNIVAKKRAAAYAGLLQQLRTEAKAVNLVAQRYQSLVTQASVPLGQPLIPTNHQASGEPQQSSSSAGVVIRQK